MPSLTHRHPNNHSVIAEVSAILTRSVLVVLHMGLRLKARRELNRLAGYPDYLLKDIGLQRSDIQRESLKPLCHD
jgi:uncharacterized protein YjiS (DUF1127 family)